MYIENPLQGLVINVDDEFIQCDTMLASNCFELAEVINFKEHIYKYNDITVKLYAKGNNVYGKIIDKSEQSILRDIFFIQEIYDMVVNNFLKPIAKSLENNKIIN